MGICGKATESVNNKEAEMVSRWLVALGLCLAFVIPSAADEETDREMKRLEGRFERTVTNSAGTRFRIVKEVAGDQSMVTTFDDEGRVLEASQSTFKVEKHGPVRVFTYSNKRFTAGPGKGETIAGPVSYIYRMEADTFTEVHGFLDEDTSQPRLYTWSRVKPAK
jgi:hypothetical protein